MRMRQRRKFIRYSAKKQNTPVDLTAHTLSTNSSNTLFAGGWEESEYIAKWSISVG